MAHRPLAHRPINIASAVNSNRVISYTGEYPSAGGAGFGISVESGEAGDVIEIITAGTAEAETGGAFSAGDALITDAEGRLVTANAMQFDIASGGVAVLSTADSGALGQIIGSLPPETIFARAVQDSSGAGEFVEINII